MRRMLAGSRWAGLELASRAIAVLVFAAALTFASDARASVVFGDLQFGGPVSKNDSADKLSALLGKQVTQLAKVDVKSGTSSGGLTLTYTAFKDGTEPIAGQWAYLGTGVVDYIAVKAGSNFVVFQFSDFNTSNMRNIGLWNTALLDNKGLSHLSAYQIASVPLPAALPLFGSALAALGFVGWRRRARAA